MYFLNGNQIGKYNKSTGVTTNVGGPSTGEALDYFAVVIGQDNWVCAVAGAGVQDSYTKLFCINPTSPSIKKSIDVLNKTVNGVAQSDPNWPTSAAGQTLGIHGISGGTGANWLPVTFHRQSWGGNGDSVFDLATNTWSLVTNADGYWSGHISMGNGTYANAAGSANGADSRGMLLRNADSLMNSSQYRFVGQPSAPWNRWCDADHNSWLNSLSNPNAPILSSRYLGGSGCNFAWTGEIIGIATDGSNTVWRFAHNHNGGSVCYYAQGFAQISNDGKWALFSSYWDGTLGADTAFGCATRIDTFIVALQSSSSPNPGGGTPPPDPPGPSGDPSSTPTPSVTRVEQNGTGVTYTGSWAANSGSFNSGSSATLSMDSSATATLAFNGTGATWIAYQDEWSGMASVYVDGVLKAQVDTYASPNKAKSPVYSISGLAAGNHTLTIKVLGQKNASSGGSWVWVDAFDVTSGGTTTPPGPSPTPTSGTLQYRVEQSSPAVTWSGSWNVNKGTFNSGGSAKLAMRAGARATFTFTGTKVSWIAYRDEWSGIARVYIDGTLAATVDTYLHPVQAKTVAYTSSTLPNGTHTIAIEAAGTKDSTSGGSWVWVDAFDYNGAAITSAVSTPDPSPSAGGAFAGGSTLTTSGGLPRPSVASASVASSGGTALPGVALISYKENGVVATEAGVPASVPISRGRILAETTSSVSTGFALANPNDSEATVSFYFTDVSGTDSGSGSLKVPPHGQVARFLNESPFNGTQSTGTFTFSSDIPVSAIALRGRTNERSEFLLTTLSVANPDQVSSASAFFPHYAFGGGWKTQFVLVNPTDNPITGTLSFVGQTGETLGSVPYQISSRSYWQYSTSNSDPALHVASAQATGDPSSPAPEGTAIISYQRNGVIVSEAGVPAIQTGNAFRLFFESTAAGDVRTGVGIVNTSGSATTARFDLVRLDGSSTGLTGTLSVPASGQRALFLDETPGFEMLPKPFKGFVRITTTDNSDLAIVGLRGRVNERSDFLITTTPPVNENSVVSATAIFPQVVDGGGFTTQFVLYGPNSNLDLRGQNGADINMTWQ
jgi:hypothetical protein